MSKILKIVKYPDKKQKALDVYDEETNTHYTVAYFKDDKRLELFLEALTSNVYVKNDKQFMSKMTNNILK